jgi:hypothetical protein
MVAAGLPHSERLTWPALIFRAGVPSNFSTVKHLILEMTLAMRPITRTPLDYVPSGPSGTDAVDLDAFYATRAREELIKALEERETLSTARFLRRVGALGPYRHRASQLPNLRKVVLEFRGSSAAVKRLKPGSRLFRSRPTELVPDACRAPDRPGAA